MKEKAVLILSIFFLLACNHKKQTADKTQPFDQDKWTIMEGDVSSYRYAMLMDLIGNRRLTGTKRNGILNIRGARSRMEIARTRIV